MEYSENVYIVWLGSKKWGENGAKEICEETLAKGYLKFI